jgi:microcystin-dependent protein
VNNDQDPPNAATQPGLDRRQAMAGGAAGTLAYLMGLGAARGQLATDPFLGSIMPVAFDFAPQGWALCHGQIMSIQQNSALFALLGTQFGGNGQTTFALPDLRGRTPIGGPFANMGQNFGAETHTLTITELPSHNHLVNATSSAPSGRGRLPPTGNILAQSSAAGATLYGQTGSLVTLSPSHISSVGGNQAHENMQPFTVVNFVIALEGIFPQRS